MSFGAFLLHGGPPYSPKEILICNLVEHIGYYEKVLLSLAPLSNQIFLLRNCCFIHQSKHIRDAYVVEIWGEEILIGKP